MPRYLIKFEDGTTQEMGFPGKDSPQIQKTALEKAKQITSKKPTSLELIPSNKLTKTSLKQEPKPKKIEQSNSLEVQINNLERTLQTVTKNLEEQIADLKKSVLTVQKSNLLSELAKIEAQF